MISRTNILVALALSSVCALPLGAQVQLPAGKDPNDWEAYFDYGVEQLRVNGGVALKAFEYASRLDPTRAEPLHGRFVAFWMANPIEDFIAWLDGNRVQEARRDVRAADSLYTMAVQRNPFLHRGMEIILFDRFSGRFRSDRATRARIAYSTGKFAEAASLYTQMIERNPDENVWRRYDRALSRVMLPDIDGALADVQAVLAELRREEDAAEELSYYRSKEALLHMIGLIYVQKSDLAAARTAFGEALVENAGFAYAQAALANVSRVERKPREAVDEFALAIELAPTDPVIRWWYAQALSDAGRYDQAVIEARIVVEAEPLWAAPHFVIGRARERQGRTSEMNSAYAAYVARAPMADPTSRALRQRFPALAR